MAKTSCSNESLNERNGRGLFPCDYKDDFIKEFLLNCGKWKTNDASSRGNLTSRKAVY